MEYAENRSLSMTQVAQAVYSGGVLRPVTPLQLKESQVVRIIVEPVEAVAGADRAEALASLKAGIGKMNFVSSGRYPSRDEIHDRICLQHLAVLL
jgi:predicted DNA-binding antitoxin AbrB/MazE fold protein